MVYLTLWEGVTGDGWFVLGYTDIKEEERVVNMDLPKGFIDILTSLGLPGVIIFVLLSAIVVLVRIIVLVDRRNSDIQEMRIRENREGYIALKENTVALNALSAALSHRPGRR